MNRIIINLALGILLILSSTVRGQENRLFWDGGDWKRISKTVQYAPELEYQVKAAYVNGALDSRLFYYLKIWAVDAGFADSLFAETVDYLSTREMVRALDNFYADPLNGYIPVPSAIIIATMYAERLPIPVIEEYIKQSRFWINNLMVQMEQESWKELLDGKVRKHSTRQSGE